MYGAEIIKLNLERDTRTPILDQLGYKVSVSGNFSGRIIKIVGIGETRQEHVQTKGKEDDIRIFLLRGAELPDVISIDKKTLEIIGIMFESMKWLYIYPDREGYFRIEFDIDTTPEELISNWETIDDEPKPLQILQVFE